MSEEEAAKPARPGLSVQDLSKLDVNDLTALTPEVISRQATINIGEPPQLAACSVGAPAL